ncbi:Phenylacetic acid catabolic protein [Pseudonocardia nigra]|uniref:Phenylacetic acid catabolic protein n=1 Tax=Pseudonocardia nigra TaxID=1921578 RepID=UPI001C5D8E89|nr:Phenylacetic acid catabolic protein [Pseudonocardia nigra]
MNATKLAATAWADDLFVFGHSLSSWITDYVDMEESLAVGSMSQECLAHAVALWKRAGMSAEERDRHVFTDPLSDWHPAALVAEPATIWPDLVAQGWLFSQACCCVAEYLGSQNDQTDSVFDVMVAEQTLHVRHWQRWVEMLLGDQRTRPELVESLTNRLASTSDLLQPVLPAESVRQGADENLLNSWSAHLREAQMRIGDAAVARSGAPAAAVDGARRPISDGDALARLFGRIREVRSKHPEWRYEIYD